MKVNETFVNFKTGKKENKERELTENEIIQHQQAILKQEEQNLYEEFLQEEEQKKKERFEQWKESLSEKNEV